jgi:hypothetical protein
MMGLVPAVLAACLAVSGITAARAEVPETVVVAVPAPAAPALPVPRPSDLQIVRDQPAKPAAAALQPQPPRAKGVPDDYKLAMLIRTSLIALNQANLTGNYSVLRDLGSPAFQRANNPARLADAFGNLRMRQVNLEPILVVEPKIAEPFINDRGMLRMKGFFPTQPEQVNFELAFEKVDSDWKLFAIAVTTSLAGPVAGAAAAQ